MNIILTTLKAEDSLFRVPLDRFDSMSDVFCTIYNLPSVDASGKLDCDDDHPVFLMDIKADDFLQFLRLLYPEFVNILTLTLMFFLLIRADGIVRMLTSKHMSKFPLA